MQNFNNWRHLNCMENTKLPVDNAALDAAYIENEPDEFITDMTDSHNGIDTADNCMKITLSVSADSDTSDAAAGENGCDFPTHNNST